jgi:methylase of polypeptide subunit release factors
MYDGKDIDKGEMNEWLNDNLEAILNGCPPEDVFEIGTGSGMILYNLSQGLRSYVGLEPSQ